ncbi:MAG: DNA alkylation repair protein [Clostridia bacterium]|nr:DNA alkylation repair protein [Clostridia bacterium]
MQVEKRLFSMQDMGYKSFHQKLIPTVPEDTVIGVRTPKLRAFAKVYAKEEESQAFLDQLPHTYYEENNLHAFLIEQIKDFDKALAETERFLPYIGNWATCDMFFPKVFLKHPDRVYQKAEEWMHAKETYTVRYGIGILQRMFLGERFSEEVLEKVAVLRSEEYYINMMIAWFFATALTKQYHSAVRYIENRRLAPWVHNKAIQKARESLQIDKSIKDYLNTLKIKGENT